MTRKSKHALPADGATKKAVAKPVDNTVDADIEEEPEIRGELIADRPDGFYWRSVDGKQEFGPFDTIELARADMEALDATDTSPMETLQEAESEIGVADWIDPETGEPAEGLSTPRLAED